MAKPRFRVGVDTGGTFTDLMIIGEDGQVFRRKVLSTPNDFSRGILQAVTEVLEERGISGEQIETFVHGTTVATNALLEGSGPRVGLLTTRGFADVLEIGRGRWGADIHDLAWIKPPPLVSREFRLELDERVSAEGRVLKALDHDQVREALRRLQAGNIDTVAVCLFNSYANSAHEKEIKDLAAREFPAMAVCISADVLSELREFERTSTTVINAYLMPVVNRYLQVLQEKLRKLGYRESVLVMQSNGGVLSSQVAQLKPVNIVESGPAAGVLACRYLSQQIGEPNLIAFDMGGTTAKASLIENGKPFEAAEYHVGGGMNFSGGGGGGHVIRVPSIEVAEVGAGGGSIAWLDAGGALRVGPRSAGASPGPACYGLGGTEPTVTDAFAVLGYINPTAIAGGAKTIDLEAAREVIATKIAKPAGMTVEDAAYGIYAVATSTMIRAIRAVTVERGRDARDYTLVAFGGAGPLHAAELARAMELPRVLIPSSPGLFSALGLLMADVQRTYSQTSLKMISELEERDAELIGEIWRQLESQAVADLSGEGFPRDRIELERTAAMKFLGQSDELLVSVSPGELKHAEMLDLGRRFSQEHLRAYGYEGNPSRIQIASLRITARGLRPKMSYADIGRQSMAEDRNEAPARRRAYFGPEAGWKDAQVLQRSSLPKGSVAGPAIIEQLDTTIMVPPNSTAKVDDFGNIVVSLPAAQERTSSEGEAAVNAMTLELIKNRLSSITDEMTVTLARTARSPVMKDSHDFSVALCNPQGELVTGGVGIAVHLGAIPSAITAVLGEFGGDFAEGDVVFMNDPYSGGMHLPDLFVFKPIFVAGELLAFAVATGHMADIGGRIPGGNAADSTEIFQEGLRIPPAKLYSRGELNKGLMTLLKANVRQPEMVESDLLAEIASCNTAEIELRLIAERYGAKNLRRYMDELIAYGERMARSALQELQKGRYTFTDYLDDDGVGGDPVKIEVTVDIDDDRVKVDFTGTSAQVRSAINAPLSIAKSAVAFVVKAMIGREIPNNAGFLRLLEVTAPAGTVANMSFPAACAARAVTAYRMTDALFGAFASVMPDRVPAAGDGGPAVISFSGDDQQGRSFVFTEVVSGACGGRPTADGLEGVASPIANARNTCCELIEASYPLRVEYYGFVPDTGGAGRYRGGLAVRRDMRFLGTRGLLQIRSDRSKVRPWGLQGGEGGTTSRNLLVSREDAIQPLPSKIVVDLSEGKMLRHITASGGGWGNPRDRQVASIERDIREGKLTVEGAKKQYGFRAERGPSHLMKMKTPVE
jgi:N-methylhydantoinase A/oxoprolinase/acetone carboxylase beta subunit/N-methylhydantoinase B/oxoprolinase/acetone carboxylase alpha subunit